MDLMKDARQGERFAVSLSLLSRQWRGEMDRRLLPFGLTESRWRTLYFLSRAEGPVTQVELASVLGVRGPTLVRTLDRLEVEGLIERRENRNDRRAKTLHLTSRAAPILKRIESEGEALRRELFDGIRDEDIETCLRVFARLNRKFAEITNAPYAAEPVRGQQ